LPNVGRRSALKLLAAGLASGAANPVCGTRPANAHLKRVAFYEAELPRADVLAPARAPPRYKVVFEDHFDDPDLGRINENGRSLTGHSPGWRSRMRQGRFDVINQEKQIYMDGRFPGTGTKPLGVHPFNIANSVLSIIANRADPSRVKPFIKGYCYTSGCITSELTHAQTYGLFEIRCKCPLGRGFWPAFWLLPKRPTWPPEIDPLEASGLKRFSVRQGSIGGTDSRYPSQWIDGKIDIADGFHVYAVEWTKEWLIFSIDGVESLRQPNFVHEDMYVIANLALGSKDPNWIPDPDSTTPLPAALDIDYVRIWSRL
jgi:Glycosyl hydrolases family 16